MRCLRLIILLVIVSLWVGCAASGMHAPSYTGGSTQNTRQVGRSWTGMASYYADKFHGRMTANGEIYDMYAMTAAHKKLAFGTIVKVTYLSNGKSVRVRINDRGPFVKGREIDLSLGAAEKIGMVQSGVGKVRLEIIKLGRK